MQVVSISLGEQTLKRRRGNPNWKKDKRLRNARRDVIPLGHETT
jgi:hypothetical protein